MCGLQNAGVSSEDNTEQKRGAGHWNTETLSQYIPKKIPRQIRNRSQGFSISTQLGQVAGQKTYIASEINQSWVLKHKKLHNQKVKSITWYWKFVIILIQIYEGWGLSHGNYFLLVRLIDNEETYKWKWMALGALGCMTNANFKK